MSNWEKSGDSLKINNRLIKNMFDKGGFSVSKDISEDGFAHFAAKDSWSLLPRYVTDNLRNTDGKGTCNLQANMSLKVSVKKNGKLDTLDMTLEDILKARDAAVENYQKQELDKKARQSADANIDYPADYDKNNLSNLDMSRGTSQPVREIPTIVLPEGEGFDYSRS